ncbi:uncharacterized protein LOC128133474 [Lactuca sativa]|uniref:uncharacterized protein LOC128133474 n=1 Tax=Lactuca sativa TaxID=4236 RepID=UPI0022AFA31E|nr:uncharacterized protein LOC128133474 [Lactuca sativa]
MVVGSGQQLMVCDICAMMGHYTDKCPTLGSEPEDFNAMGGFQGQPRRMGFQNTYNPNWRKNPNNPYPPKQNPQIVMMRPQYPQYPSQEPPYPQTSHPPPNYQQPHQQGQSSGNHQMSLQEHITYLAQSQTQFQQDTKNTFSNTQAQIGDLATALNKVEQRGKLPSQIEKNPNVSAITLRSGKTLGECKPKRVSREEEDEVIIIEPLKVVATPKDPIMPNIDQPDSSNKPIKPLVIPPHFPSRYAKFLKDLCTKKRKFKENEKIQVNANVSAVIQKKLHPKCKDPGILAIPCTIGDLHVESAMLDIGASINVIPYLVFQSLNVGPLEETGVIIQLVDKSSVSPRGVLEDVFVQVSQLVFLTDFYVIDLEEKTHSKSSMIILGRPFMNTAHTIIDVHKGKITMEFNGEIIQFNIFEAMRYPSNISPLYRVDVIYPINGISPNVCTHNILMEDYCKPKREAQRRLNPPIMEVVKKKIIKGSKGAKRRKRHFMTST